MHRILRAAFFRASRLTPRKVRQTLGRLAAPGEEEFQHMGIKSRATTELLMLDVPKERERAECVER
ncbi:hypothetical protein ACGFYZ_33590 [Streptomyces sp. NPDC048330]|uniref:hypothetical protein n=1 Tax=Streptomyces sp. NPDC048330 TaxID=3365533 RepID=UPI0037156623